MKPHTKGSTVNGEKVYIDSKEYYSGALACKEFKKKEGDKLAKKTKRQAPKERLALLTSELQKSFDNWEYIKVNGCRDPFWSDGCNMNLVRNHIIHFKDEIMQLCSSEPELTESYPDIYYKETPQEMSQDYMANGTLEGPTKKPLRELKHGCKYYAGIVPPHGQTVKCKYKYTENGPESWEVSSQGCNTNCEHYKEGEVCPRLKSSAEPAVTNQPQIVCGTSTIVFDTEGFYKQHTICVHNPEKCQLSPLYQEPQSKLIEINPEEKKIVRIYTGTHSINGKRVQHCCNVEPHGGCCKHMGCWQEGGGTTSPDHTYIYCDLLHKKILMDPAIPTQQDQKNYNITFLIPEECPVIKNNPKEQEEQIYVYRGLV